MTWGWGLDGDDFNDGEGNTSDLTPEYSQQPEQLRREPMKIIDKTDAWDDLKARDHQMDPVDVADELYRHQPLEPVEQAAQHTMRNFSTGATRDNNTDKFDFKGFLSPLALEHYARYMHKHRKQADGSLRASDNWKKGIPVEAYAESFIRHTIQFWLAYELGNWSEAEECLDAILFNVMGILHEREKSRLLNFGHSMNDLAEGSLMGGGLK